MARFFRMKFSRKVFLAIFGTSAFAAVVISLVLYGALSSGRLEDFEDSYVDHMHLLAKAVGSPPSNLGLLRELVYHDLDNLAVEIIGPNEESIGEIKRDGFVPQHSLQEMSQWSDGPHWHEGRMIVLTTIQGDPAQKYRLAATISAESFQQGLHKVQRILLLVALGLVFLSWFISRLLTTALLKKIQSIRTTLSQITQTQDYSQRVLATTGPGVSSTSADELEELGQNLNRMLETLQSHQSQLLEAERDKARTQIAAQVAHDIRSPLMSMNMALSQIETSQLEQGALSELQPLAILKSAVSRIAGIAQKLSAVSKKEVEVGSASEAPKLTLVEPLIASVVNEHRVRKLDTQTLSIQGFQLQPQVWSVVQVSELQTSISNLINNAFEAGATSVDLEFSVQGKEWILAIKDNGKGIPESILSKIFERSFTFGKKTGTGLGLFQAKAAIEWTGGNLSVTTREGAGTTFTLRVPAEKKPTWLPLQIEVQQDQKICFVDDDQNILSAWKAKTQALKLTQAHFFSSATELESWSSFAAWPEDALLVIDQNLGGKTGLEVLTTLAIGKRAYLCTSEFDEKSIQDQVKKLNGNLIPKPWVTQFELKARNG